ncbi:MAG: hypothetical protein ACLFU8_15485 [Anaerolineales bacterium]
MSDNQDPPIDYETWPLEPEEHGPEAEAPEIVEPIPMPVEDVSSEEPLRPPPDEGEERAAIPLPPPEPERRPLPGEGEGRAAIPLPPPEPERRPPGQALPTSRPPRPARSLPPTWVLLLLITGIVIVAAVGIGVLRQNWPGNESQSGVDPLVVDKLPTFNSPPEIPPEIQVLLENGNPLPAVAPATVEFGVITYPVLAVPLDEGRWPVPEEEDEVALWIYGTVVNYVLGFPYSATTEAQLSGLTSSDRVTLTLNNGTRLLFGSPEVKRYEANAATPLAQTQPGLTMVLLGDQAADRLTVRARYLPEESPEAGGAQQVADLEIDVLESGVVGQQEGGGLRYFVVEYRLYNRSAAEVDPALFELILEDGAGQRYAVSPEASQEGEYGLLEYPIPPDSTIEGSAGYLVPRDLAPPLTWIFRPDPAVSEAARFSLPYSPPLAGPPQPQVTLSEAIVDGARDVIVLSGSVRNVGESVLSVTLEDVNLTSSEGAAQLRTSTPLLPWSVEPGSEQLFELQFSRPGEVDTVLLDVLGFTFEIEGLP